MYLVFFLLNIHKLYAHSRHRRYSNRILYLFTVGLRGDNGVLTNNIHVKLPGTKDSWKSNGLTLRDQNLGSAEARDPAKFTTVVLKGENVAVRGATCSSSWEQVILARAVNRTVDD